MLSYDLNMPSKKREIGDLGEKVASTYLEKQGYSILCRNYLKKYGEIDIVAEKQEKLAFFEVKTKVIRETEHKAGKGQSVMRPEENITAFKIKKLLRVIQVFLSESHLPPETPWECHGLIVFLNMRNRMAHVHMLKNINIS